MWYPATSFEEITMLQIAHDTEQLARKVAARLGRKPEDVIRAAVEREAKALGVADDQPARKRMTVEDMKTGPTEPRSTVLTGDGCGIPAPLAAAAR